MKNGRIPLEYLGWKVIGIFGSTEFSKPELVDEEVEQLKKKYERFVIVAGINGDINKQTKKLMASPDRDPKVIGFVEIGPDLSGLDEQAKDYGTRKYERTVLADEELLSICEEYIAFSSGTTNTTAMIMSARYRHKKAVKVVKDPQRKKIGA